jgi:hypothetical protein
MIWITLGSAALAAFVAAQPGAAPANGHFTAAEVRAMCRGEAGGEARFRTQAAYALMAEVQRSKCRMYLLGVADGIGPPDDRGRTCPPAVTEREALGDLLVAAVLQPPEASDRGVPDIVRTVLRARRQRC